MGIELDDDEAWRADGVCAEVDPYLRFPDVSDTSRLAKSICAGARSPPNASNPLWPAMNGSGCGEA